MVLTIQCHFQKEKYPFIDGMFDEFPLNFAVAISVTPASFGVIGVAPQFAAADTDEVAQDQAEIEMDEICSTYDDELSDTRYIH